MIERKKYGITPLSASGEEKYISGPADFGAAARSWLSFFFLFSYVCYNMCLQKLDAFIFYHNMYVL